MPVPAKSETRGILEGIYSEGKSESRLLLEDIYSQPEAEADPGEGPGYVETIGRGLAMGTMGIGQGIGAATRWAGEESGIKPLAEAGKTASKYWREKSEDIAPKGSDFTGTFVQNPGVKKALLLISQAAPSLAAALTVGTIAGPVAAAGGLGLLEGAPQYEEARDAGKSIPESSAIGVLSTAGTTLLEYLPISKLLKGFKGGIVSRAGKGFVTEGGQEASQELWQNMIAKYGYDKTRELTSGLVEAAIGGGGTGAIAGTIFKEVDPQDLKAAKKDIDKQIIDTADNITKEASKPAQPMGLGGAQPVDDAETIQQAADTINQTGVIIEDRKKAFRDRLNTELTGEPAPTEEVRNEPNPSLAFDNRPEDAALYSESDIEGQAPNLENELRNQFRGKAKTYVSGLTPADIKSIEDRVFAEWNKKAKSAQYSEPYLRELYAGLEDNAFRLFAQKAAQTDYTDINRPAPLEPQELGRESNQTVLPEIPDASSGIIQTAQPPVPGQETIQEVKAPEVVEQDVPEAPKGKEADVLQGEAKPEVVGEVKQVHDYSSTQVNLPEPEAKPIKQFGQAIPENEIYTDPKDPSFGREGNPHITVKYGLHTVNPEEVKPLLEGVGQIKGKLGKVSIFESDNYDVVKVDIESPELHALNKKIAEGTKVTDTHPEYKPHVTIAYVKKGEGKKYVGNNSFEGKEITFNELTFSGKDGKEAVFPLEKPSTPTAPSPDKPTSPEAVKPEISTQEGVKPLAYEEFSKQYKDAFLNMNKYTPKQAGMNHFADKMAALADDYPEYLERLEAEIDAEEKKKAPRETKPPISIGKTNKSFTTDNKPIESNFAVFEADDLIVSHDTDFNENPDYPQEFQPRDRDRKAMRQKVEEYANKLNPERLGESTTLSNGAPIVGNDAVVESGNGRLIAIRKAYQYNKGKGEAYRKWIIDNAESFGLDKAALEGTKNPVLVRIRQTEIDRAAFVKEANQPEVARMSPVEQAKSDADMLTPSDIDLFKPSEEGNIAAASNRDFIRKFIQKMGSNEATGYQTEEGGFTRQLIDRIQSAIFYKAYQDESILSLMAEEADGNIKNILSALTVAAPDFARARVMSKNLDNSGIVEHVVAGAMLVRRARNDGVAVAELVDQIGLFEQMPDEVKRIAGIIDEHKRSAQKMGVIFKSMGRMLKEYLAERKNSLLPGFTKDKIDSKTLIETAIKRFEEEGRYGQKGLFAGQEKVQHEDNRGSGQEVKRDIPEKGEEGAAPKEGKGRLRKVGVVKVEEDVRGIKDARYKVDRHIVEYRDSEGNEYRKSFNVKRGESPNIPESGTSEELNALKDQHLNKPTKQTLSLETSPDKIEDFGEKIGGARKDTAESGYTMTGKAKKEETGPAWRKKYVAMEKVDGSGWTIGKTGDRLGISARSSQKFTTKEEAEAAIPLIAVAESHRVYQKQKDAGYSIFKKVGEKKLFKVVNQEFASREDALKYMAEHAEEILNIKTTFGEEILPVPDNAKRKGVERRTSDATPEMFMETFNPRGIEFGNWNNQEERQLIMNHAYDGLLDLADALGISPKALMLNGELAIAFGARGQGLTGAKAHYERDYGIINLTKMKGAGSLAHEWLHAFDHYLARLDTKAKSEKITNERGDTVYPASMPKYDYQSHGASYKTQLRPELKAAYDTLIETMYKKAEQYVEDTKQADKFIKTSRENLKTSLDGIRSNLTQDMTNYHKSKGGYSSKNIKYFEPASAEQLAEFDRLANILIEGGDLGTSFRYNQERKPGEEISTKGLSRIQRGKLMAGRHSNDTLDGINAILKAVRNRQGFNSEQTGSLDHVRSSMSLYAARLKMFEDAQAGTEKTRKAPTSYAIEAKKMDQARTGDYWSEPHEMVARAFSSYVEDKIAENGGQSDFLVYHAHGGIFLPMIDGFIARPYPEGAERTATNQAFDTFIKEIKTKETDKGVMMYEPISIYSISEKGLTRSSRKAYIDVKQRSLFDEEIPNASELRPDNAPSGDNLLRGREISDGGRNVLRGYSPEYGALPEVSSKPIGTWKSSRSRITTLEDAAVIARDNIGSDAQETLVSIVTDKLGKVLAINQHTVGGPGESKTYPAILSGQILNIPEAQSAWLVHNHPGNDAKVSVEDIVSRDNLSRLLEQSGIEVKPILAVTSKAYSAPGIPDRPIPEKKKATHIFDVQGRKFEQHPEGLVNITQPDELYDFGEKYLPSGGIILVNTKNSPVSIIEVSDYSKLKPSHLDVLKEAERRNASGFMVYDKNKNLTSKDIDNLLAFGNSSQLGLVAVYDETGDRTDQMIGRRAVVGGDNVFYSTTPRSGTAVTLKDIQSFFKGQHVGLSPDGSIWVETMGGRGLKILKADQISPDEIAFEIAYSRRMKDGELIAGKYENGTIILNRHLADVYTLAHEGWHWIEKSKLLTSAEINAVNKATGKDNPTYEDKAKWFEEIIKSRREVRGLLGQAIQKIKDFIDALVNVFHKTALGVVRDIESGKVFERGEQKALTEGMPQYSLKEATKKITDSPAFKKWFKNSKVVDEKGEPLVVYHGTDSENFDEFTLPSYFSESSGEASAYSGDRDFVMRKKLRKKYNPVQGSKEFDGKRLPYIGIFGDIPYKNRGEVWATDEGVGRVSKNGTIDIFTDLVVDYEAKGDDTFRTIMVKSGQSNSYKEHIDDIEGIIKDSFTGGKGGRVYPVYLSIKNPKRLSPLFEGNKFGKRLYGDKVPASWKEDVEKAKAEGYDGFVTESDEGFYVEGSNITQWIPFEPTQIKSIFNKGTFSESNPNILYSVFQAREELAKDTLSTIDKLKSYFEKAKPVLGTKQDLSYWKDLIASIPAFYKDKGIPAVKAIYDATQERMDEKAELEYEMENVETKNGIVNTIKAMSDLQRSDRNRYEEFKKYIVDTDKMDFGFKVRKDKDAGWVVKDRSGNKTLFIAGKGNKAELTAVDKMLEYEVNDLKEKGFTPEQINAVMAVRITENKGFDLLFASMRKLIEDAKQAGFKLPDIPTFRNGKHVVISLKQAMAEMGDMRGSYYPRIRRPGRFIMTAKKEGEYSVLEPFNSQILQKPRIKELENQGFEVTIGKNNQLGEDVFQLAGNLVKTQQIVNAALDRVSRQQEKGITKGMVEETEREIREMFATSVAEQISNIIKERGARVHMTKRSDNVYLGYEEDPLIAFPKYIKGLAGAEAKKNMTMKMLRALTGTTQSWAEYQEENENAEYKDYMNHIKEMMIEQGKQPTAFKWAIAYIGENTRNPDFADNVVGWLRGAAVGKYLAFRVFSAPLVNLTALPTSVIATLKGAGLSYGRAWSELGRGIQSYGKYLWNRESMSAKDRWIFDYMSKKGWDDAQYSSESLSALRSSLGKGWDKAISVGMFTFSQSEKLNRAATISAAFNGLSKLPANKNKSKEEIADMAKQVSDDSHGVYNKGNYPYIALGGNPAAHIARMMYVFQRFSHTYLMNMKKLGFEQKDYVALAHMVIAPAIIAGAGASVLTPIISALLKAFGIDDPEEEAYKTMGSLFGPSGETASRYGLAGLAGISIKGSLSIGVGAVPTTIKDVLGAPGSVVSDIFIDGIPMIADGNIAKGFEKILPTGMGNLIRAYRESTEGVTTRTNRPVFYGKEQLKTDSFETFLRALSFYPERIATIREKQYKEFKTESNYTEKRTDIYASIKKFYLSGERDKEKWLDILAEIQAYNESAQKAGPHIPLITNKSIKTNLKRSFKPSKKERTRQ